MPVHNDSGIRVVYPVSWECRLRSEEIPQSYLLAPKINRMITGKRINFVHKILFFNQF